MFQECFRNQIKMKTITYLCDNKADVYNINQLFNEKLNNLNEEISAMNFN